MEKFSIQATQNTPDIEFDFKNGLLEISGRSIPENSIEFYNPLFSALDSYLDNPNDKTNINIQLEYYNSSSSACLLSVLKKFEKLNKERGNVTVNWLHEENDEDILAAGKNFKGMVDLPFIMISIAEQ
jgi:hypothetical protein